MVWITDDVMLTSGTNGPARFYRLWDTRNLSKHVAQGSYSDGIGVTHLTCDHDHSVVYAHHRGEMQITVWKYNTASPSHMVPLETHTSPEPVKCFGVMPKWVIEPSKHEVIRAAKCTNKGNLEMLSFTMRNKSGLFQEDLYPVMKSNEPAGKYEDFAAGKDIKPKTFQIQEGY